MWTHTIDHKQRGHVITSAEKVSFLFRVSGSAENSKLHEAGFTDSCLLSLPPDIQIRKPGRGKTSVRTQIKGNSQIDACWELSDDSDVTEVENG